MANEPFRYQPPLEPLEILYVDKDVLCIQKPSGLLSVPGRNDEHQDSVLTRVREQYPLAQMVHRLDMDTSGVMVIALRRKAERHLKAQFQNRLVQKTYEAIVLGEASPEGRIDAPLGPDPQRELRHIVTSSGKEACTRYQRLYTENGFAWLRLFPETGRSHQIRVHLQSIACPILGDRFYAPQEGIALSERLLLHATTIGFQQPYSGKWISVRAPNDFAERWQLLLSTHCLAPTSR